MKIQNLKFKIQNSLKGFLFITGLLFSCIAYSQDIVAIAKMDSNSIKLGEQTKLHLSVHYRGDHGDIKILWPMISDTLIKQIEVVGKTKIDTLIPDKTDPYAMVQSQTLTITSFDSGYYAIPPFRFVINGDTNNIQETEAILLQVQNLSIDTTLAIKDIKAPLQEAFDFRELIPYILGSLGILAILAVIFYFARKYWKKKPAPVLAVEPQIPAHITALEALERLRHEKLWQEGKIKNYHSSITDIIRLYIESRFKISTLEQTTEEILFSFRNVDLAQDIKSKLRQLLILSDLVKFAKEQPLPNEHELSLTNAIDFVNCTKEDDGKQENVSQPEANKIN